MVASATAMPAAAAAQDANASAEANDASGGSSGLTEIIVTARKRAENLQSTPVAVSAASGEDLKVRSVVSLIDMQALAPGLSINQNQAAPNSVTFAIRGQHQNDLIVALDPPVGVYSDGVFLNSAIGVLGTSTVDLERVEILKGPQGTLYGRNTTGGAINFYTKQPVDKWEGEFTAGVGSFGGYEASGVLNAPLGNGAAIRLVAEGKGSKGYGKNVFSGRRTGDLETRLIRGALKLPIGDKFTAILRADYSTANSDGGAVTMPLNLNPQSPAAASINIALGQMTLADYVAQNNVLTTAQQTFASNYYNQFVNLPGYPYAASLDTPNNAYTESYGGSATLEYDLGDAQVKSITAYRHIDDTKNQDLDSIPLPIWRLNPFNTYIRQFTQELQLNGNVIDNMVKYTIGGYYFNSSGRDLNTSFGNPQVVATAPSFVDSTVKIKSTALFGQATYAITPTLNFTGGLRYTWENRDLNAKNKAGPGQSLCSLPPPAGVGGAACEGNFPYKEQNFSYTAGFDFKPLPDVMIYAKTSRGYKSGGVNERTSSNPLSVVPFAAERVTDYEFGLKSEWFDRRLRFNIDYYYSKYNNIQRTVLVLDPTGRAVTVIQNAARAVIQGVEADLSVSPVDNLILQATLGYTDPKYKEYINPANGADLSGLAFHAVSKWTYTLSGSYKVPTSFGNVSGRLDWSERSSRDLFPAGPPATLTRKPGYGILNAQISLKLDDANLEARFFVKNVLDKTYVASVFSAYTSIGLVNGFPGQPRTWGVNVTKRF